MCDGGKVAAYRGILYKPSVLLNPSVIFDVTFQPDSMLTWAPTAPLVGCAVNGSCLLKACEDEIDFPPGTQKKAMLLDSIASTSP